MMITKKQNNHQMVYITIFFVSLIVISLFPPFLPDFFTKPVTQTELNRKILKRFFFLGFVCTEASTSGGFGIGVEELVQLVKERSLEALNRYNGVSTCD